MDNFTDDFGRKQIFMGSGEYGLAYMGWLHQRLERAFTTLGGIQQPPHATDSEESCRQYEADVEDGEHEVEAIARGIYVALTGKKPVLEKKDEFYVPTSDAQMRRWGDLPAEPDAIHKKVAESQARKGVVSIQSPEEQCAFYVAPPMKEEFLLSSMPEDEQTGWWRNKGLSWIMASVLIAQVVFFIYMAFLMGAPQ